MRIVKCRYKDKIISETEFLSRRILPIDSQICLPIAYKIYSQYWS